MRDDTLLTLIDRIYDAATDAGGWSPFLNKLCGALGGTAAGLLQHEMRSVGFRGMVTAASDVDPLAAELYGRRYGAIDAWAQALARRHQLDTSYIVTSEALVPFAEFRRTEYYSDFARHFNYVRSVALGIATEPGIATAITVLRGERMQPFGHKELRFMEALQPHVGRALRVHNLLFETLQQSEAIGDVLDRLQTGVVLLTESGRVLFANRIARALASTQDGFQLNADGPAASDLRDDQELRGVLALARQRDHRGGGLVRLSRPSGKTPLVAFISPLTNTTPLGLGTRPLTVMFVSDPEGGPTLDLDILRATYRLTATEADIARSFASGVTLREVAIRHGLTIGSTRWYVKQILQKVGANSQVDLLRQLLTGPAAVLPSNPTPND